MLKNIRLSDLSFDDLYGDISGDLELKIERLQNRRWRKLKHELTA